jgi:hypothetical protein
LLAFSSSSHTIFFSSLPPLDKKMNCTPPLTFSRSHYGSE